nr:MAG TPA: hypothetical protein [Caudoviricetes sp.]
MSILSYSFLLILSAFFCILGSKGYYLITRSSA